MGKKYRCDINLLTIVEIVFGLYFAYVTVYAWNIGIYGVIPFLLLFMCGYLYTGLWALAQSVKRSYAVGFRRAFLFLAPPLLAHDRLRLEICCRQRCFKACAG